MNGKANRYFWYYCNSIAYILKSNSSPDECKETGADESSQTAIHFVSGSGMGGGSRAGLFRTPISGGVQSATSAHDLPRPALAVRNLMEQVGLLFWTQIGGNCWICEILEDYPSYGIDSFSS